MFFELAQNLWVKRVHAYGGVLDVDCENTPKAQRSAGELKELLLRPDIDLNKTFNVPILDEAKEMALNDRLALGGSLTGGTIPEREDF